MQGLFGLAHCKKIGFLPNFEVLVLFYEMILIFVGRKSFRNFHTEPHRHPEN